MWWVIGGVLVVLVGYGVFLVLSAFHEVKDAPRVPMLSCQKHGLIPEKYTLKLETMSEKPIEYCPLCWEDKIKAAKK